MERHRGRPPHALGGSSRPRRLGGGERHAARFAGAAPNASRRIASHRPALWPRGHPLGARGARGRARSVRRPRSARVPGASLAGAVVCPPRRGRSSGASGGMAAVVREPSPARESLVHTLGAARAWLRDLETFMLPQRCRGCGTEIGGDTALCPACVTAIPGLAQALCLRCLASGRAPDACPRHPSHRAWAAWIYDERAAAVVHALKFQGRPGLAARLGAVIAGAVPPTYRPDLIVEVPLHAARRRERGYNQAARLADALARDLGVPWLEGALARVRPTRAQTRLGPAARRTNLAGAFMVKAPGALAERSSLLVDRKSGV